MISIKELLGHASMEASERYAKLSNQRVKQIYQQTIRKVIAKTRVYEHRPWRDMVSDRREHARGKTNVVPSDARGVSYSVRPLGFVARVSRNSAKARRAIIPRFALSPVWTSSWSI